MSESKLYHDGSRRLQDRFETRRLADRLRAGLAHDVFTDDDRAFIESRPMFFLATADAEGRPDCSYKGGRPGLRARGGAGHARVPELRRQRHVQEPGQHPRQPARRAALHRLRESQAAAGQRPSRRCTRTTHCSPSSSAPSSSCACRSRRPSPTARATSTACRSSRNRPMRRARVTRRRCRSGRRGRCSARCCRRPIRRPPRRSTRAPHPTLFPEGRGRTSGG